MTGSDWNSGYAKALAVCLNGDAITEPGPRGERITDADFILLINAHSDAVTFSLPPDVGSPSSFCAESTTRTAAGTPAGDRVRHVRSSS